MDADITMIVNLTGCSREQAEEALFVHKGDLLFAIDSLLVKPVVAGDKYIPPPPKVNTGMDPEQEARCALGRKVVDTLNAGISSAYQAKQKSQLEHSPQVLEDETHRQHPQKTLESQTASG